MSDDTDIDIEIKQIQLQREHLALAHELKRHTRNARALGAVSQGVGSVGGVLIGTGRWLIRKWLPILLYLVCIAAFVGFSEWQRAKSDAAYERHEAKVRAYVAARCASARCSDPVRSLADDGCARERFNSFNCEATARASYPR